MTALHWTEINGVATVWTEAPEPLRAGLLFRTGRADETLVTAGRTHLIEHMVLSVINNRASNGFVDDTVTGFVNMGRPEDVSAFLLRVCEVLQFLPGDRLEAEKKVLSTEAASRHYDPCGNLLVWRFGAAGRGLRAMPEFGTRNATLEQLQEWRAQRFTRANAVLWLSGPPPAGLCLDLPPGEKQSLPPLKPIQPAFPSWFVDNACGGIAVGSLVPRVAASSIFNMIASNRLLERLRKELAVSYTPSVFYEPLNADTAHLVLFADSDQPRRAELSDAFGTLVEKLGEFDDAEVSAAKKQYLDWATGPLAPPLSDRLLLEVQRAAIDWLFGREYETMEFIAEEAAAVTAADVTAFAAQWKETSLFGVPGKVKIQPWMGKQAPFSIGPVVKGRESAHMDAPIRAERLVHSPEGVSVRGPDGTHFTVRYEELAAALHYDDGYICLIGSDATTVHIEPTLWRNGASICREIYGRIPAHLVIPQGARAADAIPKPKTTAWQRFSASLKQ